MNKRQFKAYMIRGLGRCVQQLQSGGDVEKYREAVLYGCLHNIASDAQSEGTRAEYMYRLASCFPDPEYFARAAAEKLRRVTGQDTWEFQHLCEVLGCFAAGGSAPAWDALRERYRALLAEVCRQARESYVYSDHWDNFELLLILLAVDLEPERFEDYAADLAALHRAQPACDLNRELDWFVSVARSNLGKRRVNRALKQAGFHREKPQEPIRLEFSAEALADSEQPLYKRVAAFRRASDEERLALAHTLEAEHDPEKRAALLAMFRAEPYPGDPAVLLADAESECPALRKAAREALTEARGEAVYAYAKKRLEAGDASVEVLEMLLNNYRPGDRELLLERIYALPVRLGGSGDWHSVCQTILKAEKRGTRLPRAFFDYIYERSLCSFCRERAVEHLSKHRWLTRAQIAECRHDSDADIRAYIARYYPEERG